VFVTCQQLLGSASNGWSSEQLASLVAVARSVYPTGLASMSDANIASLNSILLGYSNSELAQLKFGQLSSISALGALNAWTADQVSLNNIVFIFICLFLVKYKNENKIKGILPSNFFPLFLTSCNASLLSFELRRDIQSKAFVKRKKETQ